MNRMSEVILYRVTFLKPDRSFQYLATRMNTACPWRDRVKKEN